MTAVAVCVCVRVSVSKVRCGCREHILMYVYHDDLLCENIDNYQSLSSV